MVFHNTVWKITLHCSKLQTNKVTFWTWYLTCCLLGLWFVIMQCIKDTYYIDTNLTGINGIANWSPIIKCDAKLILHSCELPFLVNWAYFLFGKAFGFSQWCVKTDTTLKQTQHPQNSILNFLSNLLLLGFWFAIVLFI